MVIGIGLFSGGLDSILAVRVLQEQDMHVEGVAFVTPFFGAEKALPAAAQLGIALHVRDITEEHFAMLQNPRYGYGKNMNPCIDCHGLMFRLAGELMERLGGHFLFSGEVLGERPMSQNKNSLNAVANLSGRAGCILRPLSARLLPETKPEREGLVDRSRLLAIRGRSRKPQIELAKKYGITGYPEPAGGCRLTYPDYSNRLKELMKHTADITRQDLELLNCGRHLRLPGGVKIIAGRNQEENECIESLCTPEDILLTTPDIPGPVVIIPRGTGDEQTVLLAAAVCVRYSDAGPGRQGAVSVTVRGAVRQVLVEACPKEQVQGYII